MPSPQSLHYDRALTNLAVKLGPGSFAASRLAPVVPVSNMSDKYVIFGEEYIRATDVQPRAVRAQSGEVRWTKSDATYSSQEYPIKVGVSEDEIKNADPPIDPVGRATEVAKNQVLLAYEQRVRAKYISTSNYGANAAATAAWSAGTSILADIDAGIESVEVKSGLAATHIAIPIAIARAAMRTSAMLDLVKYTDKSMLVDGFMPSTLRGLKVILLGGRNNTANEGQAASTSRVWNTQIVGVFHIDENPGTSGATWMATFRWNKFAQNGEGVRKWWVDDGRFWYVEYANHQDEKVISTQCGYAITGA